MNTDDELLYHVDENDEVIGACRRGDAHELALRHRSVHVLVFNLYGEVFLQKRSPGKDVHPGIWDTSAAGHVDFGEGYDDCARRELAEELNIRLTQTPEFLFKMEASEQTGWEFVQVYRIGWDQPIEPNEDEISVGAWFDARELEGWMSDRPEELTPAFRILWQRYGASLNQLQGGPVHDR